jgi:hypothetical protein
MPPLLSLLTKDKLQYGYRQDKRQAAPQAIEGSTPAITKPEGGIHDAKPKEKAELC